MIQLAIFDLDGTLLNTIEDLAAATNHALEQCGFPIRNLEEYNGFVGNGIRKLFERALPEGEKTETNIERIKACFLPYYDSHNTIHTRPYEGIGEVLSQLKEKGIELAVASNKYQKATESLVRRYFGAKFTVVLGQRDNIPVKPDPAIVNDILRETGVSAENVIYIGDSAVDMETARRSRIPSIGVTWGFRSEEKTLRENGANYIARTPADILEICFRLPAGSRKTFTPGTF